MKLIISTIPSIVGIAVVYWVLSWFLPPYGAILTISFVIAVCLYSVFEFAENLRQMRYAAASFACAFCAIGLSGAAIMAGKFFVWPVLAIIASLVILLISWNSYKDIFDELNIKDWSLKLILYYIIGLVIMIYLVPQIFPIPPRLAGLQVP